MAISKPTKQNVTIAFHANMWHILMPNDFTEAEHAAVENLMAWIEIKQQLQPFSWLCCFGLFWPLPFFSLSCSAGVGMYPSVPRLPSVECPCYFRARFQSGIDAVVP